MEENDCSYFVLSLMPIEFILSLHRCLASDKILDNLSNRKTHFNCVFKLSQIKKNRKSLELVNMIVESHNAGSHNECNNCLCRNIFPTLLLLSIGV